MLGGFQGFALRGAIHSIEMTKQRNTAFIVLFGIAVVITLVFGALYFGLFFFSGSDLKLGDAVAVVDIRGAIYYDLSKLEEIESYRDDDDIKALLVFINSPGGGVAASQAIYHALLSVREKKPVVAFLASVAASGGYYVACAADSIVAHEGTLTGSIGVIATFLRTQELYRKIGLDVTVIKAGKYKDIGSPYRPMTNDEREYLGELLESTYQQFVDAVSSGRGIPVDRVSGLAEGRLYTGEEAHDAGLIDKLGTFEEALEMAAKLGGLSAEPRVIRRVRKRSLVERILGGRVSGLPLMSDEPIRLEYIIP